MLKSLSYCFASGKTGSGLQTRQYVAEPEQ